MRDFNSPSEILAVAQSNTRYFGDLFLNRDGASGRDRSASHWLSIVNFNVDANGEVEISLSGMRSDSLLMFEQRVSTILEDGSINWVEAGKLGDEPIEITVQSKLSCDAGACTWTGTWQEDGEVWQMDGRLVER